MKVVPAYPPNFDRINEAFGPIPEGVVFAYGDTIYAPHATFIPPDLHVHEETHQRQQEAVGGPEAWWDAYILDPAFRLAQEVEAYKNQIASWPTREQRRDARRGYAHDLVRLYRLYITVADATRLLSGGNA